MKLVVFAHTPPPVHGQSYMVELMLKGLRADNAAPLDRPNSLQIFHVDAKLSTSAQDLGAFRCSKAFLLLRYCLRAWWYRFAHGATAFYYIPAPGKRGAVYRDWTVMAFCRPVFRRLILHWHAVGLGEWLEDQAKAWEKRVTHALLDRADLSIVLSQFAFADAKRFIPEKIEIVPNGIPDPCPDFDSTILPERRERFQRRLSGQPATFTVLFLGACSEVKGLFATLDSIALANQQFKKQQSRICASVIVAGEFASAQEWHQFNNRISAADLADAVKYVGFANTETKYSLFCQSDCLCFPSHYSAEGQPVTIIEALAFDLPVIATSWRGIPELLAGADARIVSDQSANPISEAMAGIALSPVTRMNREVFLSKYRVETFVSRLRQALSSASN